MREGVASREVRRRVSRICERIAVHLDVGSRKEVGRYEEPSALAKFARSGRFRSKVI